MINVVFNSVYRLITNTGNNLKVKKYITSNNKITSFCKRIKKKILQQITKLPVFARGSKINITTNNKITSFCKRLQKATVPTNESSFGYEAWVTKNLWTWSSQAARQGWKINWSSELLNSLSRKQRKGISFRQQQS